MASGDTLAVFFPLQGEPPASAFAQLDTRNGVVVLDFDDTADWSIDFPGFMPESYAGGGITVTVGWAAESATSNTISLDVSFAAIADDAAAGDLDTFAFAAANNANPTAASASGEVDYVDITFTDGADMDSILKNEYFRMRITRDADGTTSTDNMTGDMELVFVKIKET